MEHNKLHTYCTPTHAQWHQPDTQNYSIETGNVITVNYFYIIIIYKQITAQRNKIYQVCKKMITLGLMGSETGIAAGLGPPV